MDTFIVVSSHGTIVCDPDGYPLITELYNAGDPDNLAFASIKQFDVKDWEKRMGAKINSRTVDILFLGYWVASRSHAKGVVYEPAVTLELTK
jgi:hypothetical protein